jgi:hypothetical protein
VFPYRNVWKCRKSVVDILTKTVPLEATLRTGEERHRELFSRSVAPFVRHDYGVFVIDSVFVSHGSEGVFLTPLTREPRTRTFGKEAGVGTFAEDTFVESEDKIVVRSVGDKSIDDIEDGPGFALVHTAKIRAVIRCPMGDSIVPVDSDLY